MIHIIIKFFDTITTFDEAILFLNENKNYILDSYSNIQTKKILYALIIYKFNNITQCTEYLKKLARNIILYSLDTSKYPKNILDKEIILYLKEFELWKKNDLDKLFFELANSIIILEEMKNNLIKNNNKTHVDNEWIDNINNLLHKLNTYGMSLNSTLFLQRLDELRLNIFELKEKIAKNIVEDIYWKTFLENIKNNDYNLLYNNFEEIRNLLNEINKDILNDDIIDIVFLKQLIQNNCFTTEYLLGYINFIIDNLLKYGIPIYDNIINDSRKEIIKQLQENCITPEIITNTFRFIMDILQKLIQVIRIYRKHINK
jgi:hypothetical protein